MKHRIRTRYLPPVARGALELIESARQATGGCPVRGAAAFGAYAEKLPAEDWLEEAVARFVEAALPGGSGVVELELRPDGPRYRFIAPVDTPVTVLPAQDRADTAVLWRGSWISAVVLPGELRGLLAFPELPADLLTNVVAGRELGAYNLVDGKPAETGRAFRARFEDPEGRRPPLELVLEVPLGVERPGTLLARLEGGVR